MNISEALSWAKNELRQAEVEGPEASAEFLLRKILKVEKTHLITHPEQELTDGQLEIYKKWIERRSKHEPVWYITGSIEFLGLEFVVNENVLIPRPETELMIEKITEHFRDGFAPKSVLDVGTGSGVIILSLANILMSRASTDCDAKFFASDISKEALAVAVKNSKNLGFSDLVDFRQGDLFEPWKGMKFDLIVTNLPYIPHEDMQTLALDLVHHEPRTALDGGHEGLEIYQRFIDEVGSYLNPGGKIFCEIGYDQGDKIKRLLLNIMPQAKVTVLGDYADIDRIVMIER
jgi:release factor glutamine methyltransferase